MQYGIKETLKSSKLWGVALATFQPSTFWQGFLSTMYCKNGTLHKRTAEANYWDLQINCWRLQEPWGINVATYRRKNCLYVSRGDVRRVKKRFSRVLQQKSTSFERCGKDRQIFLSYGRSKRKIGDLLKVRNFGAWRCYVPTSALLGFYLLYIAENEKIRKNRNFKRSKPLILERMRWHWV